MGGAGASSTPRTHRKNVCVVRGFAELSLIYSLDVRGCQKQVQTH
jgi:hypothetical protein